MISNIYSVSESANRHGVIIRAGLSASTKFFSHYLSVNNCLGYARVGSSICDSREGVDTAGPTDAASLVVGEISRLHSKSPIDYQSVSDACRTFKYSDRDGNGHSGAAHCR